MPSPFVPPGTRTHFAPDRPIIVEHLALDVALDFTARAISGRVTLTVQGRREGVTALTLDAVDMEIRGVLIDEVSVTGWSYDGTRLRVPLSAPLPRGARLQLAVDYRAVPRSGLYFLAPDADDPGRPEQCWTQGQDEDARHYVPCLDSPIHKATTEVMCTAPADKHVLSNGDLLERRPLDDGRTRWHYRLDTPQPSYLLTLVCGRFVELHDKAPKSGVDVFYLSPPGREDDTKRSLARTPDMIDFFAERIGVPYPHRRYTQVVVADFIFGGMENTTATTLTDLALLDERAALDNDMEALVAHELAHQWWGDLITCREWPEAWLNEGFATYFESLWREHARGRDEADLELRNDLDAYLAESERYERPIVCRQYEAPIEIFDAHLYEKGGRVLHMLRRLLGDEAFFGGLSAYARAHANGSVETRDLARALEEASGRSLDGFFDQWVRTPGHLALEGRWDWDDDRGLGSLALKQTHAVQEAADRWYEVEVPVWFELEDGSTHQQVFPLTERSHTFEVALPARPKQVVVDPGDVLLKTASIEKGRPLWVRQLEAAPLAIDRLLAARALGDKPEPESVVALRRALETDAFWGVRAAAATALGATRRSDALEALLAARQQPHLRVRRAVAAALGNFLDSNAAGEALADWVRRGDASVYTEGAAALALGRTRSRPALEALLALLDRRSFQEIVRARALEGLGELGLPEAVDRIRPFVQPQHTFQLRRAAVAAVARIAEGTLLSRQARELAEQALRDRDFRVRMEAASALMTLGDARAVPALEHARRSELDGRARRRFGQALEALRSGANTHEHARRLRSEVESLRNEQTALRERLEKLERAARSETPPVPEGGRKARATRRRPAPPSRRTTKVTGKVRRR